jgi:anti-anti-sigma factor
MQTDASSGRTAVAEMTIARGAPSFPIVNKDQAMTMKSPALKLMEEMAENVTVLEAHGRLHSRTAQQFGDRLVALVQAGRSAILVDLKNIIYISSAGFQALLIANRTTAESQGKLALCGVIGGVKRLFEISFPHRTVFDLPDAGRRDRQAKG